MPMASKSKEKNIERLIARCENILSGKAQFQGKEWKLAKVRPVISQGSCLLTFLGITV